MGKLLDFKSEKPFTIRMKSATKAEIIIYDQIGQDFWSGGGVTAKSFEKELKALDPSVNELSIRINSPGGDVFEGITIYNRLKQHKAKKIVHIDGLAASIASVIALAGDEIYIGEGAMFMVHLPWTFAMGNRTDLDNTVSRLMNIEDQMVGIYAKRTGLDRNELVALMEAETWLDADESLEKGFADKKSEDSVPIAASVFERGVKAGYMTRPPKKYVSQKSVAVAKVDELKNKIQQKLEGKVARK